MAKFAEFPSCLVFTAVANLYLVGYFRSIAAFCDMTFNDGDTLYNFSLASPIPHFPHGILSEDGFYKVVGNEASLTFQLCDGMIFNHDPPLCVDCRNCELPSHCGIGCSALVTENIGGYDACIMLGHVSSTTVKVKDALHPHKGVIVKMSSIGLVRNCSLSVSVVCDSNGVRGPYSLEKSGFCDYSAVLHHPSGCATVTSFSGSGLSLFGSLVIIVVCLLGAYIFAGVTYKHLCLGIQGFEMLPNYYFWVRLCHRIQPLLASMST